MLKYGKINGQSVIFDALAIDFEWGRIVEDVRTVCQRLDRNVCVPDLKIE